MKGSFAQSFVLEEYLAQSNIKCFNVLWNEDNTVYGYILLSVLDKTEFEYLKYEYLILDKNLNFVAKNSFSQFIGDQNLFHSGFDCYKTGNRILVASSYWSFKNDKYEMISPAYRFIDISKDSAGNQFYIKNKSFQIIDYLAYRNLLLSKKSDELNLVTTLQSPNFAGYMVIEKSKNVRSMLRTCFHDIMIYDSTDKFLWKYEFNNTKGKENFISIEKIIVEDSALFILTTEYYQKGRYRLQTIAQHLTAFNIFNGKELFQNTLLSDSGDYHCDIWLKKTGNEIKVNGIYRKIEDNNNQRGDRSLGLFTYTCDLSGNKLHKKLIPWKELNDTINISDYGRIDGYIYIVSKDFFLFKDGTSAFLTEKTPMTERESTNYRSRNLDDSNLYLFLFDENFNLYNTHIIKKEALERNEDDYMFSQYPDSNAAVFFFCDKRKIPGQRKGEWFLGINKIIDGKYSYEELLLTSRNENFTIVPSIAKEGYILLHEINPNEKINKMRLEKINLN